MLTSSHALHESASNDGLVQRVYRHVVADITEGRLVPGQQLLEKELAKAVGVSRTPVREALRMLTSEGLTVETPDGVQVTQLSLRDVRDLMQTAQALNGMASRLAAEKGTEEQVAELERLVDRLDAAADDNDVPGWVEADRRLHQLIQEMAGNHPLSRFAGQLDALLGRIRPLAIRQPGRLHQSKLEHRRAVEAIRARDGEAAERAMREHLISTQKVITEILENFVVPFKGEYF